MNPTSRLDPKYTPLFAEANWINLSLQLFSSQSGLNFNFVDRFYSTFSIIRNESILTSAEQNFDNLLLSLQTVSYLANLYMFFCCNNLSVRSKLRDLRIFNIYYDKKKNYILYLSNKTVQPLSRWLHHKYYSLLRPADI